MKKARKTTPVSGEAPTPSRPILDKDPAPAKLSSDPNFQKHRFGRVATAVSLAHIVTSGDHLGGAVVHLTDTLSQLEPRDAIEAMLIEQMTLTHARVVKLSAQSMLQTNESWRRMMSEEYERAANLFRRQMLAFHEYRQPPKRTFVAVRNANIANNQVVQQQITNGDANAASQEELSAIEKGPLLTSGDRTAQQTLDKVDRSQDSERQIAKFSKCAEARPAIRRRNS